ncbi:MAG: thioredoxin-dependent thiol peroxidase [Candidatus Methanofastidiosum methylothiophilum]|uniref:Thioredoxin-dependent thiol peroxidase n=1 Tax=Candidatus Methanofastidiosum methylothiophilum TaxID=1705564 RepID=A0A150IZ25_9EURY|nr:MAG: thioredoxin-dependent thiol peroxidase [Candidatus Methanofastidiosum methylthiophilus]KYC47630.1 MAG: thioredoxin-dependent thiol peroxidase [Candidatus Methanofastidiosum methylthiophilus]KYC50247.1 MAG: thioredoxin-dependent thiol peroxidase [Candidatus Methanofastidiosum methylthiophilus]
MQYKKLIEGERAINFCLKDKENKKICLDELKSKWIVLFFFDKNSFESENSEIIYYSKTQNEFTEIKAELIGIGPVNGKDINNFCSKHNIDIKLLSDLNYNVSEDYGVVYFDNYGNMKILPMTFLINRERNISKIWNREKMYYRFSGYADNLIELWEQSKMWAHISKVLDAIELLDKNIK